MRRKGLQNTANTLCHMFRGWQLISDHERLAQLGSGLLEIDVLSGECRHNDQPITALGIAKALKSFLEEDFTRHHVPLEAVLEAQLTVELTLDRHRGQRDLSHVWARPSQEFVGCVLMARSRVRTDELTYSGEYRDELEWPVAGAA
jgi:hypothetical protein